MLQEDYEQKYKELLKKKLDIEKSIDSFELVYPPIDYKKEVDNLIEEIEDLQDEIAIDEFLESPQKSFWVIDSSGRRVRIRSSENL
jgi:hypothetical protein